jgi:hypothetical protein
VLKTTMRGCVLVFDKHGILVHKTRTSPPQPLRRLGSRATSQGVALAISEAIMDEN